MEGADIVTTRGGGSHKYHILDKHAYMYIYVKISIYIPDKLSLKMLFLSKSGQHVSPVTWNQMLDNKDENTVVVDVREVEYIQEFEST